MNVPSIEESEAGWHKWYKIPYWPENPLLRKWSRKIFWMMGVIVAPEFGVAMAITDFLQARESLAEMDAPDLVNLDAVALEEVLSQGVDEDRKMPGKQKMTKSHAFFQIWADLG